MSDRGQRAALVATITVAAVVAVGAVVGASGWPGAPAACLTGGDCSCEAFAAGFVAQPVNTLSGLFLGAAGLAIVWRHTRRGGDAVVYGLLVVALGLGSGALHASMTAWGSWLDLVAVLTFAGFLLLHEVGVAGGRTSRWVHRRLAAWVVAVGAVFWWVDHGYGKYVLAVLVVGVVAVHLMLRRGASGRDPRWFAVAAVAFALGAVVQWVGRDGGPWCAPDSPLQAHAVWHVFAAGGAVAMGRHLFPLSRLRN